MWRYIMTAVMRIETINFSTMKRGSKEVRGIEDAGMLGLLKHNQRKLYNKSYEVKSKQASNIDKKRSHLNHYFKVMSEHDIQALKSLPHRVNQVGAFQMVFDFQDLTDEDLVKFHDKTHATKHAKMILAYLKEQGILDHFELLELICHNDEKNPHYHLTFSAYDSLSKDWGYNEFFSPIVGSEPVMKNGEVVYQVENRGKNKGKSKLDSQGNRIPKTQVVRQSILQTLQDNWNDFLIRHHQPYRNKKEFSSLLQYTKGVWRAFSPELKEKVYAIRKKETELNKALMLNKSTYAKLKNELVLMFNDIQEKTDAIKKKLFSQHIH